MEEINIDNIIMILVTGALLYFGWNYYKRGSLTGAVLGARIARTVGEVSVEASSLSSTVIKVHILETPPGEIHRVALAMISKAPLAASMVPIKLSHMQVRQLIELFQKATANVESS